MISRGRVGESQCSCAARVLRHPDRVLASAGVSLLAEAAFQDTLWRPNLEPLADFADIRITFIAPHRNRCCTNE